MKESLKGEYLFANEYDESTKKNYKNVKTFMPLHEYMYTFFENQAGSMYLLADEAVTLLMTTLSYDDVLSSQRKMGICIKTPIQNSRNRNYENDHQRADLYHLHYPISRNSFLN